MKMICMYVIVLYLSFALFLPNVLAQNYSQRGLSKDTTAQIGKGIITSNITYSIDNSRFAVGSAIEIWIYDAHSGKVLNRLTGHTSIVYSVCFSPDGNTLASASHDKTVRLWDAITGKHLKTFVGHKSCVQRVCFSPDGTVLASGSWDDTIQLMSATTGRKLKTLVGHARDVTSVCFSPDGKTLASSSSDKTVRLWDTTTGKHLKTLAGHTSYVSSVCFSPDGKTLASSSSDKTVRLWDITTGKHLKTLVGHISYVTDVCFSPDGKILASSSSDGTVRLWDTTTKQNLKTLTGHTKWVTNVCFSPDGKTLASSGAGGTMRLWNSTTKKHLRTLTIPGSQSRANVRTSIPRIPSGNDEPSKSVVFPQTPQQIAKKALNSTVLIVMEDSNGQPFPLGSGFFIARGMIATNLHVVEGVFNGYVKRVRTDRKYPIAGIIAMDSQQDLAIIKVLDTRAPILQLGKSNKVQVGESVYVASNPIGFLEGTFSDGIVSGIRKFRGNSERIQITAPISKGSSGAPVLNSKGEVIGIAVSTITAGQNLNFAIPSNYLKKLLSKVRGQK